jgi:hypothetical protein
LKTIEQNLVVVQLFYLILRLIQTHPIAFLKITMLNMVEQCVFKLIQLTQTHLIAFLKIIEQIRVMVEQ